MTRLHASPVNRRLVLGAGVAGLAGLAACGDDNQPGAALRFAYLEQPEATQEVLAEAVAGFTARTGRAVRFEAGPWETYPDLLDQQLASGDPPDLMVLYADARRNLVTYAQDGRLQPLEPFAPDPLDLADLSEAAAMLGRVGNVQYAVPTAVSTLGMHVDHERLDRAGVDRPDAPVTWDEFFDLCVRVGNNTPETTSGTSNQLGLRWVNEEDPHGGSGVSYDVTLLVYWLRQRGRTLFTADGQVGFDPADLTGWFTYWLELAAAGGCPSHADWRGQRGVAWGYTGTAGFDFRHVVANELLTPHSDYEFPYVEPPQAAGPDARPGHAYQTSSVLAIPAGAGDPAASADLLRALVLDPTTAAPLYGTVGGEPDEIVWHGLPPAAQVRGALATQDPPPPPAYHAAAELVVALGDQGSETAASFPDTAQLVLDELSLSADLVGTGELSVADGVDSFFTAAASLL